MRKTTKQATILAAKKWEEANRRKKEAEKEEKELRAQLLAALDAAGVDMLEAGGYIISRKRTTRHAINQKRLKEELPNIAQEYTEPQTVTRFDVSH